jgi:hypothetical protein
MINRRQFEKDLSALLNRYSMDNFARTPDFILAHMLVDIMCAYAEAKDRTYSWYEDKTPSRESLVPEGQTRLVPEGKERRVHTDAATGECSDVWVNKEADSIPPMCPP